MHHPLTAVPHSRAPDRAGPAAGWAQSPLFIANVPDFMRMLPEHLQVAVAPETNVQLQSLWITPTAAVR